jgi:hypothetical protein
MDVRMSETGELPLEEPAKGSKKPTEFNTPQVNAMIERKYAENGEYIVLFDCPDVVGTKQERRCDAVALGMWSRTGYKIHGFEVKVSRSDWLRELKQPKKSDPFIDKCDSWWLVTGNLNIAKPEEIPEYWGWLNATGSGLRIMRPARPIESNGDGVLISRKWAYSLIQRAHRGSIEEIGKEVIKRLDVAMVQEKERLEADYARRNKDYYENMYIALKKRVDDAEAASGLQLEGWRFGEPAQVGKLAGALHALIGRYDAPEGKLKQHIDNYADLAKRTQAVLDELEKHEWTKST